MRHLGAWLRALAMRRLRVTSGFYEYGAPLSPPPGPSLLFFRGIEVQTLKCVLGA